MPLDAGLLAAGEPSIRRALAPEARQHHAGHVEQMFSRSVQVFGGVCAAMLYGVLLGAIFAVAFAVVRHRARTTRPFRLALGLGAVGFAAAVLVPAMKYPANAPGEWCRGFSIAAVALVWSLAVAVT